ncbi:unnamed protein product [Calypogeia fissa]
MSDPMSELSVVRHSFRVPEKELTEPRRKGGKNLSQYSSTLVARAREASGRRELGKILFGAFLLLLLLRAPFLCR